MKDSTQERIRVIINRNQESVGIGAFLIKSGNGQSEILAEHGLIGCKLEGYGYILVKEK